MTKTLYEVRLSVDGNHSVSVRGDDPTELGDALAWANGIYLKLRARAAEQQGEPIQDEDQEPGEPPVCPTHGEPMTWQKGRKGHFWSCHNRLEDGSWCSYKPAES